jgi:5'-methylthioadenosine phosphorylase
LSRAEIGVFGGSGLYRLLDDVEMVDVETPYGRPSGPIALGRVGERTVAFLPRHGSRHTLPPAAINYRANLWAMRELGVTRIIAPTAAGSLQPRVRPGDFVVCDQFVDRTHGRADTYHPEGPRVAHVSAADPYCPVMRDLAVEVGRERGVTDGRSAAGVCGRGRARLRRQQRPGAGSDPQSGAPAALGQGVSLPVGDAGSGDRRLTPLLRQP